MRVFAYFLRAQKVGRPGGETPKPKEVAGTLRQRGREAQAEYLLSPPSYLKKVLDKALPLWYSI